MPVEFVESRSLDVMEASLNVGDVRGWVINAHMMRVEGGAVRGEAMSRDLRLDWVCPLRCIFIELIRGHHSCRSCRN